MRTDKEGFRLEPGAADGVGLGIDRFGGDYATNYSVESLAGASQSGRERNHLFLNQGDGQFTDISGVAGVDSPEDGRSFALLDFDRDGWLDLVVVNSNAPTTLLYRNELGAGPGRSAENGVIALRFVGANQGAEPAPGSAPRDGYGARVTLDLGESTLLREFRCGEGLSAQNSSTLLVGIGERDDVRALRVRWPSGAEEEQAGVPRGSLVVIYEDARQSPTGEAFVIEPYAPAPRKLASLAQGGEKLSVPGVSADGNPPELVMYTTMATWCASCRAELPELEHLRASFTPEELGMYGVPVDEKETLEELLAYVDEVQPAYELLSALSPEKVTEVELLANKASALEDALPVTVLTDAEGNVLLTRLGAPSISELRRILRERRAL